MSLNVKVKLVIGILLCSRVLIAEDYGTISGLVTDYAGLPVEYYSVFTTSGYGGDTTDSLGSFSFTLPAGCHDLQIKYIEVDTVVQNVYVYPDSNTEISVQVLGDLRRYNWPEFRSGMSDIETSDVIIYLEDDDTEIPAYFSIFFRGEPCEFEWASESSIRTELPVENDHVSWYTPELAETVIILDSECPDTTLNISSPVRSSVLLKKISDLQALLKISSVNYELVDDRFELDRTVINVLDYGYPELEDMGLVTARVLFEEQDYEYSWRVLLVFHDKVVVLEESEEPETFDFNLDINDCILSRNGRYMVVYDAIGMDFRGGNALFIDTETWESVLFDPSPQRLNIDPYFDHSDMICYQIYYTGGHLSDSGSFVRFDFSKDLQFYDREMSVVRTVTFDESDFRPGCFNFMTPDGSKTYVFGFSEDNQEVCILDEAGNVQELLPLQGEIRRLWWEGPVVIDDSSSVMLVTDAGGYGPLRFPGPGTLVIDIESNRILQHWCAKLHTRYPCLSPNGAYGAHVVFTTPWENTGLYYEVRNISEDEIVFSYEQDSFDTWMIRRFSDLADNGNALLRLVTRSTARHALINSEGNLIWVSATRAVYPSSPGCTELSTDGLNLAYLDDNYLNILEFSIKD